MCSASGVNELTSPRSCDATGLSGYAVGGDPPPPDSASGVNEQLDPGNVTPRRCAGAVDIPPRQEPTPHRKRASGAQEPVDISARFYRPPQRMPATLTQELPRTLSIFARGFIVERSGPPSDLLWNCRSTGAHTSIFRPRFIAERCGCRRPYSGGAEDPRRYSKARLETVLADPSELPYQEEWRNSLVSIFLRRFRGERSGPQVPRRPKGASRESKTTEPGH